MKTTLKDRLRDLAMARTAGLIAREASAMSAAQREALLQSVAAKTLIFTVASGRS